MSSNLKGGGDKESPRLCTDDVKNEVDITATVYLY